MYHLEDCRTGRTERDEEMISACLKIMESLDTEFHDCSVISEAPPRNEEEVIRQIVSAGRELTNRKLVDSYFGNISYTFGSSIYISQTGSSMDELAACIDAVPLDGSSSSGITASSELSAHLGIHSKTGLRAILHGHPKFTVIMSMSCRRDGCDISTCYRSCREARSAAGVPVVSGEIGTGPTGLVRTVPDAMTKSRAVIVFGHGIFTADTDSFRPAFELMQSVEKRCMQEYFKKIQGLI
jgi:ribulose-5-phosphate 4-epimerase/fuculose-1-phosphate aldolase